jgi:hypothetical protein
LNQRPLRPEQGERRAEIVVSAYLSVDFVMVVSSQISHNTLQLRTFLCNELCNDSERNRDLARVAEQTVRGLPETIDHRFRRAELYAEPTTNEKTASRLAGTVRGNKERTPSFARLSTFYRESHPLTGIPCHIPCQFEIGMSAPEGAWSALFLLPDRFGQNQSLTLERTCQARNTPRTLPHRAVG